MPRAKPLATYPNEQFGALFLAVSTEGKPITIPLEKVAALSLRADIYAWARVARAHPGQARELGIDLQSLDDVRMSLTEHGLQFYHKAATSNVAAIAEALKLFGVKPVAKGDLRPVPASIGREVEAEPAQSTDEQIASLLALARASVPNAQD